MQADLMQMVSGFITLTKTKFGPQATVRLVSTFKHLAQVRIQQFHKLTMPLKPLNVSSLPEFSVGRIVHSNVFETEIFRELG